MANLIVHAGGRRATIEEVQASETPNRIATHYPVPHTKVMDLAVSNLSRLGYTVESGEYALRDGKYPGTDNVIKDAEFFGVLTLRNGHNASDYGLVAGIRNSHIKTMPCGMVLGSRVFVCDNMAFSGEVRFGRKHTRNINRDLPHLVHRALAGMSRLRMNQDLRIGAYKAETINDDWARVAIMRAAQEDCIAWSKTGKVWSEWLEPRHDDFKPRTAWSLFNAFTEVMKDYAVQDLPKRTGGVHELFDTACNVKLVEGAVLN